MDKPTVIEMAELVSQCNAIPELGSIARRLAFHYEALEKENERLKSEVKKILYECRPIASKGFKRFTDEVMSRIENVIEPTPDKPEQSDKRCKNCDGKGEVFDFTGMPYTCKWCKGTGKQPKEADGDSNS